MRLSRNVHMTVTGQARDTHTATRALIWLVAVTFLATGVLGPMPIIPAAGAATLAATDVAAGSTTPVLSSPFVSSPATHTWYRIPAVIKNAQGELLVFAERRNNATGSDYGDFDIVMRKSSDGGRTWGPIKTIADDGRRKISGSVAVLDPLTGDVLLISMVRRTDGILVGHFLQRSTDGGDTFTPLAEGLLSWRAWTGRPGPGHAIVLTKGTHAGRIVVPQGGAHGAEGVYSDDGGRTWRSGYSQANPQNLDYVEGTIAELPSGALFIVYRADHATTPGTTKRYAFSLDGGESLAAPLAPLTGVRTPIVHGSALNPVGPHSGELLFSGPTYNSASEPTKRRDMGIFVSKDGGATWGRPYPVDLESKAASYSDLVQMDDETVGIVYETGRVTWLERIVFRTIPMDELTQPTKVASSVSAALPSRFITTAQSAKVNVAVAVKGIVRPLGKVVVNYSSATVSGTASVILTYVHFGKRQVTLPKLKRGTYAITVTYLGALRIAGKTVSAGSLRVR
jgi:sialidase-1